MADDARRNERVLAELLAVDANRRCADCGRPGTRWASWNIGIFLCTRCGGVHRSLGTHISRVKSVNLDRWTDEQVGRMVEVGNERANAMYIPSPERHPFPTAVADIEQYIRDKYERRLFASGAFRAAQTEPARSSNGAASRPAHTTSSRAPPSAYTSHSASSRAPPSAYPAHGASSAGAARPASAAYPSASRQPYQDAYSTSSYAPAGRPVVRTAAQSRYLAQQKAQRTSQPEPYSAEMRALIEMGFTDISANAAALEDTRGDVQAAVGVLVANRRSSPVLPADAFSPQSEASARSDLHDVFSSPIEAPVDPFAAFEDLSSRRSKTDDADLDALCRSTQTALDIDAHDQLAAVFGGVSISRKSAHSGPAAPADGPLIEDFAEFTTAPPPVSPPVASARPSSSWSPDLAAPPAFSLPRPELSPPQATANAWGESSGLSEAKPSAFARDQRPIPASYTAPTTSYQSVSDPWSQPDSPSTVVQPPPKETWSGEAAHAWSAPTWEPAVAEAHTDAHDKSTDDAKDPEPTAAADYAALSSHGFNSLSSNPWAANGDSSAL